MVNLFTEFKIKDLTLKNRIVMPPMCMYCAGADGHPTQWHLIHYASRAIGGTGLIIVEATGVLPEGRISGGDLGLWNDGQIDGMAKIASVIREYGARAGIQLNHAGRKCEAEGARIVAPSPIPYDEGSRVPAELTAEEIGAVVAAFKAAAERAMKAGFELLEVHAAHGYLLNQFLSPLTNKRTDRYGGSAENRARLLIEVVDAVREIWPAEKPLMVRVTAEDYMEGGNVAEDLAEIVNMLNGHGVDLVDVSTGGVVPVVPKAYPGYQISHAEIIRQKTGLPVIGGGLITEAGMADEIVSTGKADLVYVGRGQLREPYWALSAAHTLGIEVEWPKQYERAKWRVKR